MPRKQPKPFAVSLCSVCDEARLTFGDPKLGGVRYCRECLQTTLGWIQMTEHQQTLVLSLLDRLGATDEVKAQLELVSSISPELRHDLAIGESRRRLMQSDHGV